MNSKLGVIIVAMYGTFLAGIYVVYKKATKKILEGVE